MNNSQAPNIAQLSTAVSDSQKYQALLQHLQQGFCIIEVLFDEQQQPLDYRFLEVNLIFEQQTGLVDAVGKTMRQLQPAHEQHWFDLYGQVAKTGQSVHVEQQAAHLAGGVWYEVFAFAWGTANNQVAILFNDITDRKLRQQQQAFLLSFADVVRPLIEPEQIQLVACRLLGIELGASRVNYAEVHGADYIVANEFLMAGLPSMKGRYPIDSFRPEEISAFRAGKTVVIGDIAAEPHLSKEAAQAYEAIQVRAFISVPLVKAGQLVVVLSVIKSEPYPWPQHQVALAEEIAERTWATVERAKAEQTLRESEEKYRTLFNSIDEGFSIIELIFDEAGKVVDYWHREHNPVFTRMTGLTDVIGKRMSELVPQLEPEWHRMLETIYYTGEPLRLEYPVQQLGQWYRGYLSRMGGEGSRFIACVYDEITEQKRAQEALQQADRHKDEFLAMLAHELRNPMATLHNTLLLLELTQGQDETLHLAKALAMMSREVSHLNRMVDDLLDVSRISQGKIQLKKERLDLNSLIREALEAARSQSTNRSQALTLHLPNEPVWVEGDRTRLTQVVRNLATNAAKYTPNGGQISVKLEKENSQAVLRIHDNGIGLAADQLEAIFEIFVQVSSSLDRPQGGLGLGLAVVKQLVELHGGQVGVQSAGLGQGSEFTVRLPLLPDVPASMAAGGIGEASVKQRGRILVVDDNADLALTTAMLLRVKKYEAHTCLSGLEALKVVESLQPDAVLLDLGMPGMDGYETCHRLRALDWGQQGIIVALSGYGQEDDKKRTQESGFDGHLLKPVDLKTLTALLNQLLSPNEPGK